MNKRLTISIDEKLIEPLKIDAVKKSTTVGKIVEKLIDGYLSGLNDVDEADEAKGI